MAIIQSISVSPEMDKLQKEHKISKSEAYRVGLAILLAEAGVKEYDNRLNIVRRMHFFRQRAEDLTKKYVDQENESV